MRISAILALLIPGPSMPPPFVFRQNLDHDSFCAELHFVDGNLELRRLFGPVLTTIPAQRGSPGGRKHRRWKAWKRGGRRGSLR